MWKCRCGVLNSDDRDECSYCEMPRNPDAFDGVSTEDETCVLPALSKKKEKNNDTRFDALPGQ